MIDFLSISFFATNDNTISVVGGKRPNQCFCLSDTTTCCLGFALFGENQYMTLLLATEAFSDTLHTVPALPMLHQCRSSNIIRVVRRFSKSLLATVEELVFTILMKGSLAEAMTKPVTGTVDSLWMQARRADDAILFVSFNSLRSLL